MIEFLESLGFVDVAGHFHLVNSNGLGQFGLTFCPQKTKAVL